MRRAGRNGQNTVRKRRMGEKRSILIYGLGTLGLVLLITAAFFGPRIVFAVQDEMRCGAVVSMSPEEVDITSFNTGYETDLYKRLERFALGQAEGRQYYVTVQNMELSDEVADWMTSEQGFIQESYQVLIYNLGLLPEDIFDYNLISWKRCVIYGDDYAGGVNFILWYLELGYNDEPVARVLVDGETGDLYGISTNFDSLFSGGNNDIEPMNTLVDYYGLYEESMWELCFMLGQYCGSLELTERLSWLASMGFDCYPVDGTLYVDVPEDYEALLKEREAIAMSAGKSPDPEWMNRYSLDEIRDFLQKLQWRVSEDGKRLDFQFPYGESKSTLDFRICLDGWIRWFNKWETRYLDVTIGFPEIYERVPEFTADWS
ncbi:MAG: hypothetical protein NC123_00045 [Butyrivibrio sp.]|nr:hypothetical protein [Acetatifactor muris]MCM1557924.1 hypothetical protein [Butyrivibrio sp.]